MPDAELMQLAARGELRRNLDAQGKRMLADSRADSLAKNFTGHKFWARGYFVSTVDRDEETIRAYIRNQELQDRQMDQLALIP